MDIHYVNADSTQFFLLMSRHFEPMVCICSKSDYTCIAVQIVSENECYFSLELWGDFNRNEDQTEAYEFEAKARRSWKKYVKKKKSVDEGFNGEARRLFIREEDPRWK
jgi:hypothetical protein